MELTAESPSFLNRLKGQFSIFKDWFEKTFGSVSRNLTPPEAEISTEERQVRIRERIIKSLERKGVLASEEENWRVFQEDFNISPYSAPEVFLGYPGGEMCSRSRDRRN